MDVLRAGLPDVACSPRAVSLGGERALGPDFRGRHRRKKPGPRRRDFSGFRRKKSRVLTGEMEVCLLGTEKLLQAIA